MISIVIIEDDPISSDVLVTMLHTLPEEVHIKKVVTNVREAIKYFSAEKEVDLVFSDIQLPDGLSFSIFEEAQVNCPIIFTSVYDKYMVNAFEFSGIDYLVKPFSEENLRQSIDKYRQLQRHFMRNQENLKSFINTYVNQKKTRLIVKKGTSSISMLLSDIVLFYTEHFVVYVFDNKGNKYLVDKSLNTLEAELDKKMFFRANRQYILNLNYIQGYKIYERVKLLVSLNVGFPEKTILVGQEKAKAFRQWLADA
ncbi:MAG: LytR/AlgR family response regulator transcription factor [Flavisolibacter sp.]|jgi:DNA-binding LytR/AlgR family response regulator